MCVIHRTLQGLHHFAYVVYTISEVESSDRVDTPGMPEAKSLMFSDEHYNLPTLYMFITI